MTPANGASAPEAVVEAALPPEVESEADAFQRQVDDLVSKTDVLERQVNEVVDFYDGKKHGSGGRKGGRYGAYGRGMPDLMRQFGVILREITDDKDSWPFREPVDVVGLQLHDYYKIITKPMDFSTIQNKMEGKDVTTYKNVREICADVRLIFANAMKYNDDENIVHLLAKSLLEKFEEKWQQFLPKVESEEKKTKGRGIKGSSSHQFFSRSSNCKVSKRY